MRRQLLVGSLVMVALMFSTVAWAQVGGGLKGGVNFARLSGSNDASATQRVGVIAGGFVTFGLAPMIAFQPEVLFSMQGAAFTLGTAKTDYVQVPLLLRIGNSGSAGASVYALAGPTFGILVRHQGVADELKSTDLGVVVGAGVTVSRLLVEGRYTAGLSDFNKAGTVYKNRVLSLLVGVHF